MTGGRKGPAIGKMERLDAFLSKYGNYSDIDLYAGKAALLEKYDRYRQGILAWNEKVNLTAVTDPDEFEEKHYLDSLSVVGLPEYREAKTVIDVGTGGGFPGIPLALFSPEKEFLLMDSLRKRLDIIDELAAEIGISNVQTEHGRAEDLARMPEYRDQFDLCVSRAVASLPVLVELCLPFVRLGGHLIAYKGPAADQEVEEAVGAIEKLMGKFLGERSGLIPSGEDSSEHRLLVIRKEAPTPDTYPRRAGIPSKRPLR